MSAAVLAFTLEFAVIPASTNQVLVFFAEVISSVTINILNRRVSRPYKECAAISYCLGIPSKQLSKQEYQSAGCAQNHLPHGNLPFWKRSSYAESKMKRRMLRNQGKRLVPFGILRVLSWPSPKGIYAHGPMHLHSTHDRRASR